MSDTDDEAWPTASAKAKSAAQARALWAQAKAGGLRFEAYLPPGLAEWLLQQIEQGVYADPAEAVFAIVTEHRDLEAAPELRQAVLGRAIEAAAADPERIDHDEVFHALKTKLASPPPTPAVWRAQPPSSE